MSRCRRATILEYFGEKERPECDNCDRCSGTAHTPKGGDILERRPDVALPILRSLNILGEQMKPGPLKNAVITVADDVET